MGFLAPLYFYINTEGSWNLECELNVRHLTQYNTHHVELIWTNKHIDLTYQNLPGTVLLFLLFSKPFFWYGYENHLRGFVIVLEQRL